MLSCRLFIFQNDCYYLAVMLPVIYTIRNPSHPCRVMQGESEKDMKEKYTLKMFMEDYEGFDFELGTIVLFDADLCRQYV